MKTETTILKIKQELISMFASLDAWFDTLLDDGFDPLHDSDALDWIEHILFSNRSLLQETQTASEYLQFYPANEQGLHQGSFETLRQTLREQLFQTLVLIDSLDESDLQERSDHSKQMELHDKLVMMAQHLRYHLELVESGEEV